MNRRLLLPAPRRQSSQAHRQPIEMPDFRANIIRMAQEGRQEVIAQGEEIYGRKAMRPAPTATPPRPQWYVKKWRLLSTTSPKSRTFDHRGH